MNLLLDNLLTEQRNPASMEIDLEATEGILRIINQEDQKVACAVEKEIPQIAKAVDLIVMLSSGEDTCFMWAPEPVAAWESWMPANARRPIM